MLRKPPIITAADMEAAQTGRTLDAKSYEKARQDRLVLELQTAQIARRFAGAGIPMTSGKAAIIGLLTEAWEETDEYKNTNMLPLVQARNTHDMMQSVQYWMDNTRANQQRMWVLSYGWVDLIDYRQHHKAFTRLISRFAASDLLKDRGIEFVYYAVENTVVEPCPKTGLARLNLHAHVLIKSTKRLGRDRWRRLVDKARKWWPRKEVGEGKEYLHDSPIVKAAEVVKYVFKPADFEKLSDDELTALYYATWKLRFHTPLGELREFRSMLRQEKVRLKRLELDDGPAWRLVKSRAKDTNDDKERPDPSPGQAYVVAITSPTPKFSETFEPCLIVKNYTGCFQALLASNPWIEERMAALRRTAARRQARSSIKDTTTITVRQAEAEFHSLGPPEPPPAKHEDLEYEFHRLDSAASTWF